MATKAKKKAAPEKTTRAATRKPAAKKAAARKTAKRGTAKRAGATRGLAAGRAIDLERWVPSSPERVWKLWTTPEGLGRWLAKKATVELRPGGRFDVDLAGDCGGTTAENRVVAFEPMKSLELEWDRTARWGATRLAISFEAERKGTRVRLVHSGFGDGPEWDEWYEGFDAGWAQFLAVLATAAEDGGRREATVSEQIDAPAAEIWKALGTPAGLARWFTSGKGKLEARAGGRYALTAGPVPIEGEVREFEKDRTLAFTWSVEPCTQKALELPTVVTVHLTPVAKGGTFVSLVHSGFGDGPEWDEIYARHAETWKFLLANLRTVVSLGVDQRGRSIERSLLVKTAPARAYDLFATKAGVESWFAPTAQVGTAPGQPFVVRFHGAEYEGSSLRVPGRIVEAKPGERFAYVWPSFGSSDRPTLVTVDFKAEAGGTRITLVESGFGRDAEWDEAYLEHKQGWGYELSKLFAAVEGLGERGRALQLSRTLAAPPARVWDALVGGALGAKLDLAPGASVSAAGFRATVRESLPGESLALALGAGSKGGLPASVLATFTLALDAAGGTRLSFAAPGLGSDGAWTSAPALEEATWTAALDRVVAGASQAR